MLRYISHHNFIVLSQISNNSMMNTLPHFSIIAERSNITINNNKNNNSNNSTNYNNNNTNYTNNSNNNNNTLTNIIVVLNKMQ